MKVLYISYDGMTDPLGQSQVLPYLAGLASKGHEIHLLSFEKWALESAELKRVAEQVGGLGLQWHPLSFTHFPPGLAKVYDLLRLFHKARQLQKEYVFDLVHCRSYIAAFAGRFLKRRYGPKFVFDIRGFWVDERVEGGMWNMHNPVFRLAYGFFKRQEKSFFREADQVVSLTHKGKQLIGEMFGTAIEARTWVIPCCVDTELFAPEHVKRVRQDELRKQLRLEPDDLVISYLGSLGTWYMSAEMLRFFRFLQLSYPEARFLFITGDSPQVVMQEASKQGVDEAFIRVVKARREDVPLYLSLSGLSLFFIRPVFSKQASSPTKQAEIMSMGIPLVCNAGIGDTDRFVADEHTGIVLQDFSEAEFQRAVEALEHILHLDPEKIRQVAHRHFDLSSGIAAYDSIYRQAGLI